MKSEEEIRARIAELEARLKRVKGTTHEITIVMRINAYRWVLGEDEDWFM